MDIELTEEQRQALAEHVDGPVNVIDSASQRRYVILGYEEYERMAARNGRESAPPYAEWTVSPGVLASQEAYWRDLPELLKLKFTGRQWVAYHREERIGFAGTDAELYQECARRGIPTSEFYVDRVEPRELPPWAVEEIEA